MTAQLDPYAGQGGAYELLPDGTRRLVFRTGEGAIEPDPVTPDPAPTAHRTKSEKG